MSESEEMYLVTIARLKEAGTGGPVPLSQLASELDVLPVSANQMVRKLEEAGLVTYLPYKGADLTDSGCHTALEILRHRRLWEVFLVERLGFTPEEADSLACRLEHALPGQAAERLAAYLGQPQVTPRGDSIPAPQADQPILGERPLFNLSPGAQGTITRIEATTPARSFLAAQGFTPGNDIEVLAASSEGDVLAAHPGGAPVHLSSSLATSIWIHPKE